MVGRIYSYEYGKDRDVDCPVATSGRDRAQTPLTMERKRSTAVLVLSLLINMKTNFLGGKTEIKHSEFQNWPW